MLRCVVLCFVRYVVLCYVMLCCVMLCYVMLCYVMLCYAVLCCPTLHCVMLCCVVLCYITLQCVVLLYVMDCFVMLHHVMVCYAMLGGAVMLADGSGQCKQLCALTRLVRSISWTSKCKCLWIWSVMAVHTDQNSSKYGLLRCGSKTVAEM